MVNQKVGILALQGAVGPHVEKFKELGIETVLVRKPEQLASISGIVLPGGESTAMIHLLKLNGLWEPLREFVRTKPTWGVCAGVILLAKNVTSPAQASLEAMDITVQRNAYGRQNESFVARLSDGSEGVFIRAPRITKVETGAKVLLSHADDPIWVEQRNLLASTFHPELTDNLKFHRYFVDKIR